MITIIPRKSRDGLKLSVRLMTSEYNTAIALGVTVTEDRWISISKTLKQARSALRNGSAIIINDTLISQLWNLLSRLLTTDNVTPENIKKLIPEYFNTHKVANLHTISPITYLEKYIQDMIDGKVFPKNTTKHYSANTIKNYKTLHNVLVEYNERLSWNDFTSSFNRNYKKFLFDRGYKDGTITSNISTLKAFLKIAEENHLISNAYQLPRFKSNTDNVPNIYLTEERIYQLYNMQFDNIRYNEVKDVFILSSLIGQRYSDVIRINADNIITIKDKEFIHLIQQKTGEEVYIPITQMIRDILSKYQNKLPIFHISWYNRCLKRIGKLMEWNEYIPKVNKRFYECLSSHTARRSFATNAYKRNIPLSVIMSITGHTTEMMLRRYLKLDTKEKAIIASEYFK